MQAAAWAVLEPGLSQNSLDFPLSLPGRSTQRQRGDCSRAGESTFPVARSKEVASEPVWACPCPCQVPGAGDWHSP